MGRLLVILLVILLPLRGWSAQHMATQMIQSQVVAATAGVEAMPADCPMVAQAASQTETSLKASQSHAGCQTCQLCMALAAQEFAPPSMLSYERHAPSVSFLAHFISADLPRQAKPPIF